MSLREYQKKRDFSRTAEPDAATESRSSRNRFVIQKHDASRLHYDFRLEMDGVLKSWAVPKGLPWQKGERHLAVHVEDHPVDYATFEGIIPKGQYGGGTVMVWEVGDYEVIGAEPAQALREGKLHLVLHGGKVTGEWTLVRKSKDQDDETWFLIKTGQGIPAISKAKEEHSALTGRTLAQIAAQKSAVWESNRKAADEAPSSPKRSRPPRSPRKIKNKEADVTGGDDAPAWVEPMKAKLVEKAPSGDGWIYELKWDGYRAIAIKNGAAVKLISRNEKSLSEEFPEVADALEKLPAKTAVIDGEICALDSGGLPRFQLLQHRAMGDSRPPIYFYAFDLLHLNGQDLKQSPLEARKRLLEKLLSDASATVRFSAGLNNEVREILKQVRARGMEGVVGKRSDSVYEPGKRSGAWVKIKVTAEQEFVIGGFTPPKGTREHLGALLVGYYEGERLRFAGKVGAGFDRKTLDLVHAELHESETPGCPFADLPQKGGGRWGQGITPAVMRTCTWVIPKSVCQIRFSEWTADGSLRHPVFLGMRRDKGAKEVVREIPADS